MGRFMAGNVVESPSPGAPAPVDAGRLETESSFHDREFARRSRTSTDGFYAITRKSWTHCIELLHERALGGRVLELGCGPGSHSFALAALGAQVVGIDISRQAVEESKAAAAAKSLGERMSFELMNAEALDFESGSFDLVFGLGLLHHVDLTKALPEIARVMRPHASAIFLEPMGHNPFFNLYRRYTPELRTPTEHPLLLEDLALARKHFKRTRTRFFHLAALLATPLRGRRSFWSLLAPLEAVDEALFRWLPATRKLAWIVVLDLAQPECLGR
jgi:SAM-dependent methyltransferase